MPGKRAEGVTVRNFSVEDSLWAAAKAKAAAEGISLSEVLRRFLRQYVAETTGTDG